MQITNIPIERNRRETTHHGSPDFPLAVYNSVMGRNVLGYTPLHWHEELQICLVTRGEICFHVQEQEILLPKGDGIYIGSGYLHTARPTGDPESSYICLNFLPALIGSFHGSAVEQKYLLPALSDPSLVFQTLRADVPWQKEILDLAAKSLPIYEEKPAAWELALTIDLSWMFLLLLENHRELSRSPRRSRSNVVVQRIISYVAQHYMEKITLGDLAREASYAQSECCRVFKKYTGESIFSYLRAYRLERSVYLLNGSDLSVSEIAYACGFSSTSYYIEHFRKQFGVTPLKYRQQNSEANSQYLYNFSEEPRISRAETEI